MGKTLYTSRSHVKKIEGLHRQGVLESGATFDMGVHGPIVEHFRLTGVRPLPLPVDYIVTALGG